LIRGRGNGYIREASPLLDSPFSTCFLIRGRGIGYAREASPFFDSPFITCYFKEKGEGILEETSPPSYLSLPRAYPVLRVFKRGVSPSFQNFPPLLDKERGIQGVRSP